jgi:hypothetical protein
MASRRCASRDWPPRTRLFPPLFSSFSFSFLLSLLLSAADTRFILAINFCLVPFTLPSLFPFPFYLSSASYFILTRRKRKTAAIELHWRRQPTEWIKRVAIKDCLCRCTSLGRRRGRRSEDLNYICILKCLAITKSSVLYLVHHPIFRASFLFKQDFQRLEEKFILIYRSRTCSLHSPLLHRVVDTLNALFNVCVSVC